MAGLTATHISILKKLREDTGVEDLSLDTAKTIAAVDARYISSSARVTFTMLKKVYPGVQAFIDEAKKRAVPARAAQLSQVPTQTQIDAHVPWDKIIAWRDSADLPILDKLLVGLYTYLPPQRADYTPMMIVKRLPKTLVDGMNYVVILKKSARFVFHAYKTAKVYGDRIINVPPPLFALLTAYLGERRDGYLLQDGPMPWTPTRLGDNLRRIFLKAFGKLISVNALRHSYITKECAGMPSIAATAAAAAAMAHNVISHQTYRHITLE
jgi:hypothetical protein